MPGTKGVKLIPRRSTTGKYHSVRELVFSLFDRSNGLITRDEAEKIIKKEYPKSNFFGLDGKNSHFTWYKHKWNKTKLEREFTSLKKPSKELPDAECNESIEDRVSRVEEVDTERLDEVANRTEDQRIPSDADRREMGLETRKKSVQHRQSSKRVRRKSL